jgi:hypothetical protein
MAKFILAVFHLTWAICFTLKELLAQLNKFPPMGEHCHWILPNGRSLDETVAFFEGQRDDVLKIWKTPSALSVEMYGLPEDAKATMTVRFRHEQTSIDCPNGCVQRLPAIRWVETEFGIRRELLRLDVHYLNRKQFEVIVNERLLPQEGLEHPDDCLVWVILIENASNNSEGKG